MIDEIRHLVDVVLVRRDWNHVEDLHQHAVELDHVPARLDEAGVEQNGGCVPEERDLTWVVELVPPVEECDVEKRVDRKVRQKLRYGINGCTIDVAPNREMQFGAMAGAGHRQCGHADSGECRDIDLGASAPNNDIDTSRASVRVFIVLISDSVIRFAEPLQVLAINLSGKWRSSHIFATNGGSASAGKRRCWWPSHCERSIPTYT